MVKERKAIMGMNNLTQSSEKRRLSRSISNDPQNFVRSLTHKLVSPDDYPVPEYKNDKARKIQRIATWRKQTMNDRDFETVASSSYKLPSTMPVPDEPVQRSSLEIEQEAKTKEKRLEALEAFCLIVERHYGSTTTLLKSFNKRQGDDITLKEFGDFLRRNKFDGLLPPKDQELIFDHVNEKHNGSVPVSDFLGKAEVQEFRDYQKKKDIMKVRDFLDTHIKKHRQNSMNMSSDPDLDKKIRSKGLKNEQELFRKAVGQMSFDINVHHDELEEVLNNMVNSKTTSEEEKKYTRFLRHANLKLAEIPFYDMRSADIENCKFRAAMIERDLEDPKLTGTFNELSKTRWKSSLTVSQEGGEYFPTSIIDSPYQTLYRPKTTSGYINNKPFTDRNTEDLKPMNLSNSMPALRPPPLSLQKLQNNEGKEPDMKIHRKPKPKNLVHDSSKGNEIMSLAGSPLDGIESISSGTGSKNKKTKTMKLKEEILNLKDDPDPTDFYLQIVDSQTAMGRMKDPSKVMRVERLEPVHVHNDKKRMVNQAPTDWTRIGLGGDLAPGYGKVDQPYLTTTKAQFTPLIYEPSQPIERVKLTADESPHKKKERYRNERYKRVQANLQVTKTRLEYEELEAQIRELHRNHKKMDDALRYRTSIFLNDLRNYKKQPLQRMAKRQNIEMADRMYKGNHDRQTAGLVGENRDFLTTYTGTHTEEVFQRPNTTI